MRLKRQSFKCVSQALALMSLVAMSRKDFAEGKCTWTSYANTNVPYGVLDTAQTVEECQQVCLTYDDCAGIDWDPGWHCWLTGSGEWYNSTCGCSENRAMHYSLNRSMGNRWTAYPDMQVDGAVSNPASNLIDCQAACLNKANCTGVDWLEVVYSCWLTPDNPWNNGTSAGVTHYAVDKGVGCPETTTQRVTTTLPTTPGRQPHVISIWPLYGPLAGGTRMTVSGHLFSRSTVRAVLIGSYRLIPDTSDSLSTDSVVTVVTPAVNETLQRHLPIAVELTDGSMLSTNFSFEYRDNPKFVDIQPREHLLVGGTQLTVNGSSLDSVAHPSITVTVAVTRFSNVTTMTQSTADGPCWFPVDADAGGYEMLCRMPPVELPPDFDSQQNTSIRNISETSGVAVYYGPNGRDRADVYVGLQLDGLTTYNNISAVKPDIKMEYYAQPTISCLSLDSTFNPQTDAVIAVKGSNLAHGSRLVDFNITVGSGICENVDLTDNQVTCRPPKMKPPANQNSSFCSEQLLSVDLSIGNAYYHCSCLRYEDSSKVNVALIVGLTVGLGVPLLLLIAGLIAVYCRRVHSTTDSLEAKDQNAEKGEKGVTLDTYDELYKKHLSYA